MNISLFRSRDIEISVKTSGGVDESVILWEIEKVRDLYSYSKQTRCPERWFSRVHGFVPDLLVSQL